jgi:hypothetical protein
MPQHDRRHPTIKTLFLHRNMKSINRSINSTDVELKEILAIFLGVSTTRTVRKAFHLLLLFNTTSYKTISKYIFEMFILFIIPVILLKNNRDANILNLIY